MGYGHPPFPGAAPADTSGREDFIVVDWIAAGAMIVSRAILAPTPTRLALALIREVEAYLAAKTDT